MESGADLTRALRSWSSSVLGRGRRLLRGQFSLRGCRRRRCTRIASMGSAFWGFRVGLRAFDISTTLNLVLSTHYRGPYITDARRVWVGALES